MAAGPERVAVQVVYATPAEQVRIPLQVGSGSSVREAIEISGLLDRFPDIDLAADRVGIYGRLCALEDVVREGDRIEVYRPLRVDPKEARRLRATARAAQAGRR
ncbi:MAG: Protein RnfH [Gammaproteobacteria bacterium]|nr:Protein RnfH [Gammaproteobacteria bacterium]